MVGLALISSFCETNHTAGSVSGLGKSYRELRKLSLSPTFHVTCICLSIQNLASTLSYCFPCDEAIFGRYDLVVEGTKEAVYRRGRERERGRD